MPSALFRGRRSYVEHTCDRWFILSARYGLIAPDEVVETYDVTLVGAPAGAKRDWATNVQRLLERSVGDVRGITFECHAGADYLDFGLAAGLLGKGALIDRPAQGLGLGQQLAFYAIEQVESVPDQEMTRQRRRPESGQGPGGDTWESRVTIGR
jgi:hypothetical protein